MGESETYNITYVSPWLKKKTTAIGGTVNTQYFSNLSSDLWESPRWDSGIGGSRPTGSPGHLRSWKGCFMMYRLNLVMWLAIFDTCIKCNIRRRACVPVAEETVTTKICAQSTTTAFNFLGCQSASYQGASAEVCVCNTPLCNSGPVMPGSSGIIVVAMVISFITARLM